MSELAIEVIVDAVKENEKIMGEIEQGRGHMHTDMHYIIAPFNTFYSS
jgi:hypothetical protein